MLISGAVKIYTKPSAGQRDYKDHVITLSIDERGI